MKQAFMENVEEVNITESTHNEPAEGYSDLEVNNTITEVATLADNSLVISNQVEVDVSTEEAHNVGQVTGEAGQAIDNSISNSNVETVKHVTWAAQAPSAMEKDNTVKQVSSSEQLPEIVVIHAKACFERCPNDILFQDDLDSLTRFVTSKDYLKKNITSVEFDRVTFDGVDEGGTFEHSVQLRIAVLQRNLWQ